MKLKAFLASLTLILLAASSTASAVGNWTNVTVLASGPCTAAFSTSVCGTSGSVSFELSANAAGTPPGCSNGNRNWVVVDTSNNNFIGAYIAQVLTLARLTGQTVSVWGIGSCGIVGNEETVGMVNL